MGLDMHLLVSGEVQDHPSLRDTFASLRLEPGVVQDKEIAYWRKVNSVHGWFVDNVQGGEDDREEYPVTVEQLEALREDATASIDAASADREGEAPLQPREGFYFGSTNMGDYYINDLKKTVEMLDGVICIMKASPGLSASYVSSW